MKARYIFAAIVAGAIAAGIGYLAGVQVGFVGGVRASAQVFGCDPKKVMQLINKKRQSPKERNARMGD